MKLKNLFFAVASVALLTACDKEVAVTGISIDPTAVTFNEIGQKDTLTATLAPADAKADVVWTSSNTAVVTVEGDGMNAIITAVGNGTAKISATADIFTTECSVTVNVAPTGVGSKENPYAVEDAISKSSGDKDKIDEAGVWVKGFIVGHYNSNTKQVETADADGYNIMIASSASQTDKSKMVCVQVPAGDIRNGLALMNNATLLGKEVIVHGDITTYNTLPGVKNTDGYWLIESNTGINPPEPGNFNVPVMSISELLALYTGSDVTLSGEKKIVGVVTSDLVGGNSTSKKNLVVTSENNLSGIAIRFSDKDNTYSMGDKIEVLLSGKLTKYAEALQLSVALVNTSKIGTANIAPRTTTIEAVNANLPSFEFCVVTVPGVLTGPNGATTYGSSSAHQTNVLTNGTNKIDVFVAKYSTFVSESLPSGTVNVTGIVQKYNTTNQLIIRNLNDVK
ncbi:MAG: DUF6359 domain-containing protein [Paludibacter sp.]|nr:DUF6359 domain-containing protein [Paludibacter sp.]